MIYEIKYIYGKIILDTVGDTVYNIYIRKEERKRNEIKKFANSTK